MSLERLRQRFPHLSDAELQRAAQTADELAYAQAAAHSAPHWSCRFCGQVFERKRNGVAHALTAHRVLLPIPIAPKVEA